MIRKIHIDDGKKLLNLMLQLDQETQHMMYEPGERKVDEKRMTSRIEYILHSGSMMIVSEAGEHLNGFLMLERGQPNRIKHSAYIVIGILKEYHGQGIGRDLFSQAIEWAKAEGLHRLSLTVKVDNHNALGLYEKIGFNIEGIKKDSMLVDGKYVDEYYMGLLLE